MAVLMAGDTTWGATADLDLKETIADVYHQIEDRNWQSLTLDYTNFQWGQDFSETDRMRMLWRIRNIARRSPVAKAIIQIARNYTFGSGITIKAADADWVQPYLTRLWADPVNERSIASIQAQNRIFTTLHRDGNLFTVAIADPRSGQVRFRDLDMAKVADIISDPDDLHTPRWYKVKKGVANFDFQNGIWAPTQLGGEYFYLRDWRYQPQPGDAGPKASQIGPGVVFHDTTNQEGKWGFSELYAAEDWITAHKGFMEDRASLLKSLATIAWVVTRKDNPSGVQAFAQSLQSTLAQSTLTAWEQHPNPAAGATLIQNQGTKREPMRVDTGGDQAVHDGESLLQMAGIGGMTYTHYLGSVQAHKLATVSTMELPMLKNFEAWQTHWRAIYMRYIQYAVDCAIRAGVVPGDTTRLRDDGWLATTEGMRITRGSQGVTIERSGVIDRTVQIEFPPILVKDLAGVVNAVAKVASDIAPINVPARKLLLSIVLTSMGIDDVENAVDRCFPEGMTGILAPAQMPKNTVNVNLPDPDHPEGADGDVPELQASTIQPADDGGDDTD